MRCRPLGAWAIALIACAALAAPVRAGNYSEHSDPGFGAEINILWPFPPFRTYEVKLRGKLGHGVEAVVGYGRQAWTYEGKRHNEGTIDSHALLLGMRAFPLAASRGGAWGNASVEYTAWLCHDVFHHKNGNTYRGFSYANEFYLGYAWYLGSSPVYLLPQWNAGFYSYKAYQLPLDDDYVFDFLPKLTLGMDF